MTKTATQKVTQVCVLDQNGQPLMPTQRLGKVYRLLETKKAHIVAYEPFTIKLDYEPKTHIIQPLTLGIDSGAIHSGYSIAAEVIVLFNNHRYYIKSRRSSGSFTIVSLEGLKDEKRSYKKLTFLGHTNAYLTNHHVNDEKDYMASK